MQYTYSGRSTKGKDKLTFLASRSNSFEEFCQKLNENNIEYKEHTLAFGKQLSITIEPEDYSSTGQVLFTIHKNGNIDLQEVYY